MSPYLMVPVALLMAWAAKVIVDNDLQLRWVLLPACLFMHTGHLPYIDMPPSASHVPRLHWPMRLPCC
jgi:hypothetical protein